MMIKGLCGQGFLNQQILLATLFVQCLLTPRHLLFLGANPRLPPPKSEI